LRTHIYVSILVDGLSIPFFSASRRTLTLSRSLVVDQPDWLLWVRRDAPQVDTERVAVASEDASVVVSQESRREWQKQASQSDLPDTVSKAVKIAKRAVKIDVCAAVCRVTSPFWLIRPLEGSKN
jgi:hypothetical protein